jgi:hypothetical protein
MVSGEGDVPGFCAQRPLLVRSCTVICTLLWNVGRWEDALREPSVGPAAA